MKKFLFLLAICSFLFANCKTSETENDITSEYYNILNQNTLSVEEKCAKITELFIKEHNIKTALSVSVKNEKNNFYKNYGVSSLNSKSVCDSETLHYIYSITKTFTSALALSLCEENILNLKETVEHHLPELFTENYAGSKDLTLYINKDASIEQLLNHTSGIYDFAKNSRLYNTTNNIFSKPWNPELILDYIEHPKEKIGTYLYSSTNYVILGLIIQKVTGKSLNILLSEYFYEPLELSDIFLAPQDEPNYNLVAHPHVYPNTDFNLTGDGITPINLTDILKPLPYLLGKASWTSGGIISNADTISRWGYELYSEKGNAISKDARKQLFESINDINADKSDVYGYGIRKLFYNEFEFAGSYGRSVGSENLLFYNEIYDTSFCILSNCNTRADNSPNIDELLFWLFECIKS